MDAKVTMVTVTADQIHPTVLKSLIPAELPCRHVDTDGPYYRALAGLCTAYAAEARG